MVLLFPFSLSLPPHLRGFPLGAEAGLWTGRWDWSGSSREAVGSGRDWQAGRGSALPLVLGTSRLIHCPRLPSHISLPASLRDNFLHLCVRFKNRGGSQLVEILFYFVTAFALLHWTKGCRIWMKTNRVIKNFISGQGFQWCFLCPEGWVAF